MQACVSWISKLCWEESVLNWYWWKLRCYQVYDSATDCWKKTCILPPGFYRWHHGILCNGFLYSRRFQFDGLVAYDMEQGVWSQIQAPMPHAFDYHALVECQGRIFTIGGQLKNDITKRICILQLERTKLEWVEVSTRGIKPKSRVYPHMYCYSPSDHLMHAICIWSLHYWLKMIATLLW